MTEKELEEKLKRYKSRNLKYTRKYLISQLEKDPNFKMGMGIMVKEDFIDQYYESRKRSGKPIFNYDFSSLPDIIYDRKTMVDIFVNEVSTKTKSIIGPWKTNYKNFIVRGRDNGSLSGMLSKSKTEQYIDTEKYITKSKSIFCDGQFGYDKTVYVNSTTPVTLLCNTCGNYFNQRPAEHLESCGCCPECARKLVGRKNTITKETIIEELRKIYGDSWNYDTLEYNTCNEEVSICDKKTGIKYTRCSIYNFLQYDPRLKSKSKGEVWTENWLRKNNIEFKGQYKLNIEGRNSNIVFVDFYLESLNTIIEVNGIQHYKFDKSSKFVNHNFENFKKQVKRDNNVKKYCKENNINFLEIPYTIIKDEKDLGILYNKIFLEHIDPNTLIDYPEIKIEENYGE